MVKSVQTCPGIIIGELDDEGEGVYRVRIKNGKLVCDSSPAGRAM
jgi:hypothetical protein